MDVLTPELRAALIANGIAATENDGGHDPVPIAKLFDPVGAATWLATEPDADGDTLFGLADLGFGCPELGTFSLSEIAALRPPLELCIERDLTFASAWPLSRWADMARATGSISAAEQALFRRAAPLPPPVSEDG